MQSLNDLDIKTKISLLLLGVSGTGKTSLLLQFPKPFILNCDDNLNGPVKFLKRQGVDLSDVTFATPIYEEDGTPVPREEWFKRSGNLLSQAGQSDCETIIVDSLTTFTDFVLIEVLRLQGRTIGDVFLSDKRSKLADSQMQQQDWGAFFNAMKALIMQLKSWDKNIVFTGHTKTREDSATNALYNSIACPGQTADLIAGFFEEVWLLKSSIKGSGSTAKEKRTIQTFPASNMNTGLGLKSPSGLPSGSDLDPEVALKYLFG